jgi:hypothetical protein
MPNNSFMRKMTPARAMRAVNALFICMQAMSLSYAFITANDFQAPQHWPLIGFL